MNEANNEKQKRLQVSQHLSALSGYGAELVRRAAVGALAGAATHGCCCQYLTQRTVVSRFHSLS